VEPVNMTRLVTLISTDISCVQLFDISIADKTGSSWVEISILQGKVWCWNIQRSWETEEWHGYDFFYFYVQINLSYQWHAEGTSSYCFSFLFHLLNSCSKVSWRTLLGAAVLFCRRAIMELVGWTLLWSELYFIHCTRMLSLF
jgi:hypothetical protein